MRRIAYGLFVLAATVVLALWPILNHDAYKQNVILLAINLIGVYRYLIRKKPVHGEAKAT